MNTWKILTATALVGSMAAFAPASAQEVEKPAAAEPESAAQTETEIIALPEWHYDELYADGVSVSELIGDDVFGPTGEDIGTVENVIFSTDGKVLSVIAEVGGFLEIGDTHVSVPWDEVDIAEEAEVGESAEAEGVILPLSQETSRTIRSSPTRRSGPRGPPKSPRRWRATRSGWSRPDRGRGGRRS